MRKHTNRVEELATGYWSATLTECEEQELRQALEAQANLSDELQALKIMLGGFDGLATEHKDTRTIILKGKPRIVEMIATLSAAAAILAFGAITHFGAAPTTEPEIYCYINGKPITDVNIALEQTKYLEPISNLSETINALEQIMLN
ncbi:MAG: hypothetical protein R3Y08_07485 [Rikenellaceae bacterium]